MHGLDAETFSPTRAAGRKDGAIRDAGFPSLFLPAHGRSQLLVAGHALGIGFERREHCRG